MEDVGTPEHGQRREVPAERPAGDGHPSEVELARELVGDTLQGVDLVLERLGGQVEVDAVVPGMAPAAGAASVGDDDGEALVGEPLRLEIGVVCGHHHPEVRAAVRRQQHRQRPVRPYVVAGHHDGGAQLARAGPDQPGGRPQVRAVGVRRQPGDLGALAEDRPRGAGGLQRRGLDGEDVAAGRAAVHPGRLREPLEAGRRRPPEEVTLGRLLGRLEQHEEAGCRRDGRLRLSRSRAGGRTGLPN